MMCRLHRAVPTLSLLVIMASRIVSPCLGFEPTLRFIANSAQVQLGSRLNTATIRRTKNRRSISSISKGHCPCFASPLTVRESSIRREKLSSSQTFKTQPKKHHLNFKHSKPTLSFHHHQPTNSILSYPYSTLQRASLSSSTTENDNISSAADDETLEEEDTIFALSSGGGGASVGSGATAVAIIRISGPCALDALRELMSPYPLSNRLEEEGGGKDGTKIKLPKLPKARMASLRTLYDPLSDSPTMDVDDLKQLQPLKRDPLDSALVLTFPGPNSFTGEDIVELHCHGSRAVVQGVLSALKSLNLRNIPSSQSPTSSATAGKKRRLALRPADPGEFTQRAYAHGKLGLVEVEALADLIVSDTSLQRKQALQQFDGRLSRLYMGWRKELIKGLAHAEAVIDFGDDEALDEDEDDMNEGMENDGGMSIWGTIRPQITSLRQAMDRHLSDASRGELLRDGLRIAIVGRPNAGKSSLLNLLAGRDAAIVSSTPGTTRDVVEVILDLGGVRCTLLDTAGVREEMEEGVNDIEVEGMKRARRAARDAHIVVGVVDASSDCEMGMDAVDEMLIHGDDGDELEEDRSAKKENVLYVLNKLDLVVDGNNDITSKLSKGSSFGISCTTSEGVDSFLSSLTEQALSMVSNDDNDSSNSALLSVEGTEGAVITRARHRLHVEAASEALSRFETLSGQGYMSLDMAAEELRLCASELGRVTGAIDVENILDVLFADFCIGK